MKYGIFFWSLLTLPLYAQQAQSEVKKLAYSNPFTEANQDAINMLNRTSNVEQISLLMFEDWQPMESLSRDSTLLLVDSANYHIELDKIMFILDGRMYALYPERIFYAKLGESVLINRPYSPKRHTMVNSYFEVLVAGAYSLLCKYEIRHETKNDHPMGLTVTQYTSVSRRASYFYLSDKDRVPQPVPTKRKDFIMMFRRFRPELVIYAKENRISLHDREDLKAIFTYFNQLVSEADR